MLDANFSIGIWAVVHPSYEKIIYEAQEKCQGLGIDFRIKEFHINNFSMGRKTNITETPPERTIRILSYGDSIAWGFEVGDDQHYFYLVEQLLNRHSTQRYEVLNTARGSLPSIYAIHLKKDK